MDRCPQVADRRQETGQQGQWQPPDWAREYSASFYSGGRHQVVIESNCQVVRPDQQVTANYDCWGRQGGYQQPYREYYVRYYPGYSQGYDGYNSQQSYAQQYQQYYWQQYQQYQQYYAQQYRNYYAQGGGGYYDPRMYGYRGGCGCGCGGGRCGSRGGYSYR